MTCDLTAHAEAVKGAVMQWCQPDETIEEFNERKGQAILEAKEAE